MVAALGRAQTVCDSPPGGLVNWWQAEGSAVDIIGGATGKLYPGTSYAAGEVGQGFSFDGVSGCVMNTNTPDLSGIQNNFTIEFWAYPQKGFTIPPESLDYLNNSGQSFAVFPDWGGYNGQAGVGISVGTNGIAVLEHAYNYLPSLLSYSNNLSGWVHIAVVYTNKQPILYVDGVYARTGIASTRSFVYPSKNFGTSYDTSSGYSFLNYGLYKGLLDEVSIYDRALSAGEIQSIYAAGSAGKCFAGIPPAITTQPAGATLGAGGSVTFNVIASGSGPLSYQWSLDGTNLIGATNYTLAFTNVQPVNAGVYGVTVTNSFGSVTSSNAVLTVETYPPVISVQPANATVNAGDTVTLSVSATGTAPLSYQWSLGGTDLAGATSDTLTLADVQLANAGVYAVTVTNIYGAVTSSNASLTVLTYPPVISSEPTNVTIAAGGTVIMSITAGGTGPLSYQWSLNGTNLPGATDRSLTLLNVQPVNAGNYEVTVTNLYGSLTSSNALLTVLAYPPVITSEPTNVSVTANGSVTFSVQASGTGTLKYQWSFNGTNIIGATASTFAITDVAGANAGDYEVTVTNLYGSVTSSNALLTVLPAPPCDPVPAGIVDWWPAEGNAIDLISDGTGTLEPGTGYTNGVVGQAFSFDGVNGCVMNDDTPSLTSIQNTFTIEFWAYPQKAFNILPEGENLGLGTSGQSYAIFPEWGGNGGQAGIGISVGTNGISVLGHAAGYLPSLLSYPVTIKGWVHVAVVFTNKQPTLYLNGVAVRTGVTSSRTFVYPSKNLGSSYDYAAGYSLRNYGPYKGFLDEVSIYSRALGAGEIQAIYAAGSGGKCSPPNEPVVTLDPTNETVAIDGTATFIAAASGLPQLKYQWLFNGTNLSGATNPTLTLASVQAASAGNYQALVTNSYGSVTSAIATLTVILPPSIVQPPLSQTVLSYSSASFTVLASGTGPYSYQWLKNGTNLTDNGNITGSKTATLNLASVTLGDAGSYQVQVSNPYAGTNSVAAVLTVPETAVSLGTTNAMSGSIISVPVWMDALGVENTLLASVNFDPTKLVLQSVQLGAATAGAYLEEVDSQTNNGNVGFAILLDYGAVIPAGTQQVAQLVFATLPVTNTTVVSLNFGDVPTARQLVDNNLDLLPMVTQNATVTLSPAEYAGDVYPRFNGDHQLTVQDWLEEGRLVANLDTPTNSDEMLRADCAPRNAPDGVLTVADWVQAGRYALGLDPLTLVTPPVSSHVHPQGGPVASRTLQVGTVSAQRGQTVSVPVLLVCTTNENAVGMTLSYNPSVLKLSSAGLGSAMSGGRLNINSNLVTGKVGLALCLSPGQSLPAGTNQVAVLQFTTGTNAANSVPLTLESSVAVLQLADKVANVLAANYVNGAVVLPPAPTVQFSKLGANLELSWPAGQGAFQVLTASHLTGPWQPLAAVISTNGANATVTVPATNQQQYYRLSGQ